ncbi:MAG: glycosyltransferase family 39 protein [Helicobacteraceae bacterium]|nr:glycosyltransferase family 39 protein [Helicobacteraceae bacterium]
MKINLAGDIKDSTIFSKKASLKDKIIAIAYIFINLSFWIALFIVIMINFYAAGSIFTYGDNHDHHLAFFSYLSGMAANGILPGIDFYSPHSVFIPLIVGIFFKIFGISQVNLGLADGVIIFLTFIFIYKSARFVISNIFAKLAILTLLLSHSGRDLPWFNDVIMLFVAMGIYFLASYINDNKRYKLIILGIICFMLPYLRHQGLVIAFVFLSLPLILFYINAIKEANYKRMFKNILFSFLIANLIFLLFIFLRNGIEGLEILFFSLTSLVDMSQPAIGYDNSIPQIAYSIFNYTSEGMDWHGYFIRFLSYWFIVIIPSLYFIYRPFSLYASKQAILNEDSIRFVTALVVLSTIVFNYPINEDARMKVQFGVGIWLFIDSLRLCFYNKNIKIISIIALAIVFLLINHSKITEFSNKFYSNYTDIFNLKGKIKMDNNTPYSKMKFRDEYAQYLNSLLYALYDYNIKHPNKQIIFDGELVEINAYLFLLFSGNEVALQHKFPYHYGSFDRYGFVSDLKERFNAFVDSAKPIIIGCSTTPQRDDYKVLKEINEKCKILVPKE